MEPILNYNSNILYDSIKNVLMKIFNSIDNSEINNSENSNIVINKILENPNDERLFNEAVEYLKQHKDEKEIEISLSNKESLTISIE